VPRESSSGAERSEDRSGGAQTSGMGGGGTGADSGRRDGAPAENRVLEDLRNGSDISSETEPVGMWDVQPTSWVTNVGFEWIA
jgi:hypothetical protein